MKELEQISMSFRILSGFSKKLSFFLTSAKYSLYIDEALFKLLKHFSIT